MIFRHLKKLTAVVVGTDSAFISQGMAVSCLWCQGSNLFLKSERTVVFVRELTSVIWCFPGVSRCSFLLLDLIKTIESFSGELNSLISSWVLTLKTQLHLRSKGNWKGAPGLRTDLTWKGSWCRDSGGGLPEAGELSSESWLYWVCSKSLKLFKSLSFKSKY